MLLYLSIYNLFLITIIYVLPLLCWQPNYKPFTLNVLHSWNRCLGVESLGHLK